VNERIVLSSINGESLISNTLNKIEEQSHSMFHITCCGASISKDAKIVAIGDFSGTIKLFDTLTGKEYGSGNIGESVRYLHFHDYQNEILLIGTFSGNLFVWNNVQPDSDGNVLSQP
jgi:WD40 repeat protein